MNDCEAFPSKFSFFCILLALKVDILRKNEYFLEKVHSDVCVFHFSQVIRHTERHVIRRAIFVTRASVLSR